MAMHETASSEQQPIDPTKLHEAVSSEGDTLKGESLIAGDFQGESTQGEIEWWLGLIPHGRSVKPVLTIV